MLKASDIPAQRDPTDEDARVIIENCLYDEDRLSELPTVLLLYEWYRQQSQEDAEFTIHYALTVTIRYIHQSHLYTHKESTP